MTAHLRQLRNFLVSLQLTVVLLVLSLVLVFVATLAQRHFDISTVQERYFRTFLVFWQPQDSDYSFPIFPGGYLIGGLLLVNLVCAHIYRFRLTWRKLGIHVTHLGLILLLVGELLSGLLQRDGSMRLEEGETRKYSESFRDYELALLDKTNPDYDEVVAIPDTLLADNPSIQHPKLPFRVTVKQYLANAVPQMRDASAGPSPATAGIGTRVAIVPQPRSYRADENNNPAAYVELAGPDQSLGTWLVSPLLGMPQTFSYRGHTWEITLRLKRTYRPFSLTLLKVTNDIYPGTDIPKNFSSRVRLKSDDGRENREVLIYMNNPLRYGGVTFYQYQMNAAGHLTVLEVVQNPGWVIPYVSCSMVAVGLLFQFGLSLSDFLGRRRARNPRTAVPTPWWSLAIPVLAAAYLAATLLPPRNATPYDLRTFGQLPVLANGRIKPLDTVARNSLLSLKGSQSLAVDERELTPTEWLADVFFAPERSDAFAHFRIDNQEVLDLAGLARDRGVDGKYFSFAQLQPKLADLDQQARLAEGVDDQQRSVFQRQLLTLRDRVVLYLQLRASAQFPDSPDFAADLASFEKALPAGIGAILAKQKNQPHDENLVAAMKEMVDRFSLMEQVGSLRLVPPNPGDTDATHWRLTGTALLESFGSGHVNPTVTAYAALGRAWRTKDAAEFNRTVQRLAESMARDLPNQERKAGVEARFNSAEPFYSSMVIYVAAFFVGVGSWLKSPRALGRAAAWLVRLAFLATTVGIIVRMWLEGRPPVTNLYSSALFVGWGAVGLCIVLERTFRNGFGTVAAGLIGFGTLLIAHHLALGGDTLEMMRAVLDSNFWLATHVVIVTTGYASTFLAGFLALLYLVLGLTTDWLSRVPGAAEVGFAAGLHPVAGRAAQIAKQEGDTNAKMLERMVYGIVCFATLFSFVGTVLGGIWADQSWGRFWGWDPKENGALIIVLWNATFLHARWGGLVRAPGLMVMAVFGNIVTSWSWFGVNLLGIGLHSYGFMETGFYWLIAFIASQLLIMAIVLIPQEKWRSFQPRASG